MRTAPIARARAARSAVALARRGVHRDRSPDEQRRRAASSGDGPVLPGRLGFTEVRSFDIEGAKTGLYSYALRSPCGTFCIPINEDKGETGQIAEYLREYRGPGCSTSRSHPATSSRSLDALDGAVPTLDIDADYYEEAFARVPGVREDRTHIARHHVLVDGDASGYLLQIFTKNLVGPIFFELIQRENHLSFGEGNFSALFRSIERDQERRGAI